MEPKKFHCLLNSLTGLKMKEKILRININAVAVISSHFAQEG